MNLLMQSTHPILVMRNRIHRSRFIGLGIIMGLAAVHAKPNQANAQAVPLGEAGQQWETRISASFEGLKSEISGKLPTPNPTKLTALEQAREALKKATADADAAQKNLGSIGAAKGLVAHAKGKWIGGAEKGIAQAEAALASAATDAARESAKQELAKWDANRREGLKALEERQAAYDAAMLKEPEFREAHEAAQAALAEARTTEEEAASSLLSDLAPFLSTDKLDPQLVKAVTIASATPRGLAGFAQQGSDKAELLNKLLADTTLMEEMLVAGGARSGHYGRAMEIYTEIQKASTKASSGHFKRLALATALEHARPVIQSNAKTRTDAPQTIDPVKRYLHYEKASLAGELDPAFPYLSTWEYRHVVNSDAPDEILTWGREMLRNYRPDHITNPDYGWRYVSSVRTEVPYGSENVKFDDDSLQQYQNIIRNGGVCGRRAFFGRFILRAFGIPTWGVTQRAHAALSHWTPKGWVVNLGAGFGASWWDKDDVPLSGNQFVQEAKARTHEDEYIRALRAQWVGRILGEPAYNDRKKVAGGFWSGVSQAITEMLAAKSVTLGPLGQELAEANDKEQKVKSTAISREDQQISVNNGTITIPAVAHGKTTGKSAAMNSHLGGMQLHALGGFTTQYEFEAPKAGDYRLTAKVATVQTGQILSISTNDANPVETPVPYTLGMWKETEPLVIPLVEGRNILHFRLADGSRGVTIKELVLTPAK